MKKTNLAPVNNQPKKSSDDFYIYIYDEEEKQQNSNVVPKRRRSFDGTNMQNLEKYDQDVRKKKLEKIRNIKKKKKLLEMKLNACCDSE